MRNDTLIIGEVKIVADAINKFSALCRGDSLLACYADSKDFRAFSGDGKMRDYAEFKQLCIDFYNSVYKQDITTTKDIYNVIDDSLVILSWIGNIDSYFKNGDVMKSKDYGVTFVFRKFPNGWKVIHSHESSSPPEIIKASGKK